MGELATDSNRSYTQCLSRKIDMKPGSAYCTEDKYGGSDIKYTVIHYNHVKIKERSKLSTHMNNF